MPDKCFIDETLSRESVRVYDTIQDYPLHHVFDAPNGDQLECFYAGGVWHVFRWEPGGDSEEDATVEVFHDEPNALAAFCELVCSYDDYEALVA